ncbi:hypothetical protein [Sphingorhabdus sp. Alg239-R122]|uniref:hypothetical protein n=1 Tax=Sphingorhabdus sp. Alg239-R122 TaxID=2305989 RepID=UPI0013DAE81C|nr:hypothetical protein [Sphingorhabdus sp. Alg239-R122]
MTVFLKLIATSALAIVSIQAWANDSSKNLAKPLAPLDLLSGSCWHGQFAGQEKTDTHCFIPIYGGAHILDRHRVDGGEGEYAGSSVYSWNPKEKRIEYVYFDSHGGVSRGWMKKTETGFSFPDETYLAANGMERIISSRWLVSVDKWVQTARENGRIVWQVTYERKPLSDYPELSMQE